MEQTVLVARVADFVLALGIADDLGDELARRRGRAAGNLRDRPQSHASSEESGAHDEGIHEFSAGDAPLDLPPVLTVEEVARFLRLNVKTVHAAIDDRQLPGRKVGRRTVVYRDALLDWLRSGQGRVSRSRRSR